VRKPSASKKEASFSKPDQGGGKWEEEGASSRDRVEKDSSMKHVCHLAEGGPGVNIRRELEGNLPREGSELHSSSQEKKRKKVRPSGQKTELLGWRDQRRGERRANEKNFTQNGEEKFCQFAYLLDLSLIIRGRPKLPFT